jgi:hypothetical protein
MKFSNKKEHLNSVKFINSKEQKEHYLSKIHLKKKWQRFEPSEKTVIIDHEHEELHDEN